MRREGPLRVVAGIVVGLVVAWLGSVVLAEYQLTIVTALVAAVALPLAVGESMAATVGVRGRAWELALTAILSGLGLAWGTWLSGGRGLQPWPTGGWVAVTCGVAWPAALGIGAQRRRRVPG